jgi:hypothetical protein
MVWLLSGGRMIKSEWKKLIAEERAFKESVMRDHEFSEAVLAEHTPDNVNNPADYIEDFLTTEEYIGYLRGNIAKYLHRWRYKNKQEDLLKSQWYLDRLIKLQGKEQT